MKKTVVLILAACLLLGLTACGGKKEMDGQTLADDLLANADFTDSLSRLDDQVVPALYGLDAGDYTDCVVYCGTAATAEEIAIFQAVDEAAAGRIPTAAEARVASRIETYKDYGPAEAMKLEDAVVRQSGLYVVVVVCSDAAGAEKIVDQYI